MGTFDGWLSGRQVVLNQLQMSVICIWQAWKNQIS